MAASIPKPIHVGDFYHDGRGPELVRFCWSPENRHLLAAEFVLPDAAQSDGVRHVQFIRSQVFMVTPEEVIGHAAMHSGLSVHRPAAMFDLGKSEWLSGFSQRHLDKCHHFQLMFYDELLDVIAEEIRFGKGHFVPNQPAARL